MIRAALFAFLLIADYRLILQGQPAICAKDKATCEMAREAVARGWIEGVPRETPSRCEPAPGCFSARSNCIEGWNCR